MRFGLVSSLVLAIVAVIFALQNPQPMDVNLLFFQTEGSTALVLLLTFGFGVLVALISTLPSRIRTRRELRKLKQEREETSDSGSSFTASKPAPGSTQSGGSASNPSDA